ncbi:MAG: GNAT family N-acetyltransferase [bacterium]|nr:MAG: GNAT family N-acetyltransferase [bacterium]
MPEFEIKKITTQDRDWIRKFLTCHWGSHMMVSRGRLYDGSRLPGFVAVMDKKPVGLCTYHLAKDQFEITTLNSLKVNLGIGTSLLAAAIKEAKRKKCRRIWLITTNDNLHALGFYQRRGFSFHKLYPNSIAKYRQLKPEIPFYAQNGIPIRDELELEICL